MVDYKMGTGVSERTWKPNGNLHPPGQWSNGFLLSPVTGFQIEHCENRWSVPLVLPNIIKLVNIIHENKKTLPFDGKSIGI
jgi:hypothetical protein